MKKIIFIVLDNDAEKIYARAVTISKAALDYYDAEELARIMGGGHSVFTVPAEMYNGPIHERLKFDIKPIGDFVANMITKEETDND